MENAVPDPFEQPKLRDKADGKQDRPHSLKNRRALDNPLGQTHHSADLQGVDALLHQPPLLEADFPSQNNGQENANADKAQAAQLNHDQNQHLAEQTPLGPGVHHHQARHAGGAGGCEQTVEKRLRLPVAAGNGQGEQKRSRHNNDKKTVGDKLSLGNAFAQLIPFFSDALILFHIVILVYHSFCIFIRPSRFYARSFPRDCQAPNNRNASRFTTPTLAPAGVDSW